MTTEDALVEHICKAHGEHEMRLAASKPCTPGPSTLERLLWYECRYCRCLMAGMPVSLCNKPCVEVGLAGE